MRTRRRLKCSRFSDFQIYRRKHVYSRVKKEFALLLTCFYSSNFPLELRYTYLPFSRYLISRTLQFGSTVQYSIPCILIKQPNDTPVQVSQHQS